MDRVPISKENKRKLKKLKKALNFSYTYQTLDVVVDIAMKVYEKNPEQIVKLYSKK